MSARTREHVDAFWSLIDYVLNAVLFLLIALEVFGVPQGWSAVRAGLVAIPIALIARAVSVALPILAMRRSGDFIHGIVPILTWSGLRGGISVACRCRSFPASTRSSRPRTPWSCSRFWCKV